MFFFHANNGMTVNLANEAAAYALGYHTSEAGRLCKHGASYGVMERLKIVEIYFSMTIAASTLPSINMLAKESKCLGKWPGRLWRSTRDLEQSKIEQK